jgi:predicted MPP superfamily phosphohydrolase
MIMKISEYEIKSNKLKKGTVFALISDLHGESAKEPIECLKKISPDYILAPGDIFEPLVISNKEINESGYELLSESAKIAPTIYSPGNHEIGGTRSWHPKWRYTKGKKKTYDAECTEKIKATGVIFLDDEIKAINGISFCGLCSGLITDDTKPDLALIERFASIDSPKIMLCHHPEYYKKFLKGKGIDLIVSGHAHGGQWRIFGRGVYAPGQGIFPKYTSGVFDDTLVVSRGLREKSIVPRIFNPTEVVKITIEQ